MKTIFNAKEEVFSSFWFEGDKHKEIATIRMHGCHKTR